MHVETPYISMQNRSVTHCTFAIERSYPVTPERVFAAFADPAGKRRWFAEGDHRELEEFEMDFRAGATERCWRRDSMSR